MKQISAVTQKPPHGTTLSPLELFSTTEASFARGHNTTDCSSPSAIFRLASGHADAIDAARLADDPIYEIAFGWGRGSWSPRSRRSRGPKIASAPGALRDWARVGSQWRPASSASAECRARETSRRARDPRPSRKAARGYERRTRCAASERRSRRWNPRYATTAPARRSG